MSTYIKKPITVTKCVWHLDLDGEDCWRSGCGGAFIFENGSPKENHFHYCCYCGKPLEEAPAATEGKDR